MKSYYMVYRAMAQGRPLAEGDAEVFPTLDGTLSFAQISHWKEGIAQRIQQESGFSGVNVIPTFIVLLDEKP